MAEQAPFYIFTAFIFTYGTTVLGASRDLLLVAVLTASVLSFFAIPFRGYLSDRIGRKTHVHDRRRDRSGVFGFIYFALLDTTVRRLDLPRDRAVADPARHDVRPAGGADRGDLHAAAALQRRFARLPARLDHRRRPRAADRDRAVRHATTRAMPSPSTSWSARSSASSPQRC